MKTLDDLVDESLLHSVTYYDDGSIVIGEKPTGEPATCWATANGLHNLGACLAEVGHRLGHLARWHVTAPPCPTCSKPAWDRMWMGSDSYRYRCKDLHEWGAPREGGSAP